jgi:outer membrane protein assembly factor BamB
MMIESATLHPFRCCLVANLAVAALAGGLDGSQPHWPTFRGPQAGGVAESQNPPTHWSVPNNQNVRWKTPIPGLGHSSPVVWGERLFVTTAVSDRAAPLEVGLSGDIRSVDERVPHRWQVFCLSTRDGRILWQRTVREGIPTFKRHPKSSHANPTPATDGSRVVVFFGSEGLFCFDLEGRPLWDKNFGPLDSGFFEFPRAQWGFASSPVLHAGAVLVQCDAQPNSFLAALDARDGRQLWRTPRQDVPAWSTPTVVRHAGRTQVVVNGFRHIGGYDFHTGRELWRLDGGGDIPVPTPIFAHGLIFITGAHGPRDPIYAIRAEATGDISLPEGQRTNAFIVWSTPRGGNYMQTPIVVGDHLYCCSDAGVLACYDARTGQQLYRERLGGGGAGGFTASPVAAAGRLYCTSERGTVYVVRAGERFEVLATNALGETCLATPAVADDALFFRTRHHVVAIGAAPEGK